MSTEGHHSHLKLNGVRQNNLKNIDVEIPLGSFTVICGPSGSGKSSLAFQTLFAEGQRRYLESLSNYSKQFIMRAPKPDLDSIENIPPSIALQQKNTIRSSRSCVGTSAEIYDHLRLLYAKIGQRFCPEHNLKLKSYSPVEILDDILDSFLGDRGYIHFPLLKTLDEENYLALKKRGIQRVIVSKLKKRTHKPKAATKKKVSVNTGVIDGELGEIVSLEEYDFKSFKKLIGSSKAKRVHIVVDRISVNKDSGSRIYDSISQGYSLYKRLNGDKNAVLYFSNTQEKHKIYESNPSCAVCDYSVESIEPHHLSFNSPLGACETCKGFGNILELDERKVIPDTRKSVDEGALEPFNIPSAKKDFKKLLKFCEKEKIPVDVPWAKLKKEDRDKIWNGKGSWFGVTGLFAYLETKKYKIYVRVFISNYKTAKNCKSCSGSRLKKHAGHIFIDGKSFFDASFLRVKEALEFFESLELTETEVKIIKEPYREVINRLKFLYKVGLGYLSLSRATKTLSGGEYQRLNLAHQIGSNLTQTLYVLDEPTIGLHPRDNEKLIETLKELHGRNNTLVLVEHDSEVIEAANYIIEMGPQSGIYGGEIIFEGTQEEFLKSNTKTYQFLNHKNQWIPQTFFQRDPKNVIKLEGCTGNNLKSTNFELPLNAFVCITGVSGSGKSSLVVDTLYPALSYELKQDIVEGLPYKKCIGASKVEQVILVDQKSAAKTSRSSPISYIKGFDHIRKIFSESFESKRSGFTASHFSLNTDKGRCPSCKGLGYEEIDMIFMDDVSITCDDCEGKKFKDEILKVKFQGKNIFEVLDLTVTEAIKFFVSYPPLIKQLKLLVEVGLGYLKLGQSLATLSGGENQRIKLSKYIQNFSNKKSLFILDEPTTGLHFEEIELLLRLIRKLTLAGHSIVVIEHNLDVVKNADWIVDIGPEAGEAGGQINYSGDVLGFMDQKFHTAQYLQKYVKRSRK